MQEIEKDEEKSGKKMGKAEVFMKEAQEDGSRSITTIEKKRVKSKDRLIFLSASDCAY